MSRFWSVLLGGVALPVSSCATVGVTRVNPADPKGRACKLDIYTSESEIKRPFTVLCLIDSRTAGHAFQANTSAEAIEHAKPKACECGADALLIVATDTEGMSLARWGQGKAMVKAIRYGAQ